MISFAPIGKAKWDLDTLPDQVETHDLQQDV